MRLGYGLPLSSGSPARSGPNAGRRLGRGRRLLAGLAVAGGVALAGCVGEGDTGLGISLVSQQQVQQLGLQSWQKLRQETPRSDNRTYQLALQRVGSRLLAAAGENPDAWEMVVFEGDAANAFALPGNKIGVYEGLFRYAQDEAQLAAVIGHEIAHNQEQHAVERLNSTMAAQLGVQLAGAVLGASGYGDPRTVAALLGAGAQYGLVLPYARNQELEADRRGLMLMARAGYDPRESITLWRNMSAAGARTPDFLSTHPGPENRIAQLERYMPEALAVYRERG